MFIALSAKVDFPWYVCSSSNTSSDPKRTEFSFSLTTLSFLSTKNFDANSPITWKPYFPLIEITFHSLKFRFPFKGIVLAIVDFKITCPGEQWANCAVHSQLRRDRRRKTPIRVYCAAMPCSSCFTWCAVNLSKFSLGHHYLLEEITPPLKQWFSVA